MTKNILIILLSFLIVQHVKSQKATSVKGKHYELKIAPQQKALLILFPCYPCSIEQTKTEASFLKDIEKEGISTLILDYNQKLFLTEAEKAEYKKALNTILDKNKVKKDYIFIGGFSSGGNVATLLTNDLLKTKDEIQPKGLIVVDSPLDLEEVYHGAQNDIHKNTDQEAVEEGQFLIDLFEKEIGNPHDHIEKYKALSPYLISSHSTGNINYLKDIKTRFYCEPDLEWQINHKNRKYEELNAYQLEKVNQALIDLGSTQTEFIMTKNRGIRANGTKHPHSWNIIERKNLVEWILKK